MATIFDIRKATGMSQDKFCALLNIPSSSLRKWEQGQRECPAYLKDLIEYRVKNDPVFGVVGNGKGRE